MRLQTALRCKQCCPRWWAAIRGPLVEPRVVLSVPSPYPQILCRSPFCFSQGICPGSVGRKEWGKRCLFPPQRSLRISLIQRLLINSSTETALENVHIIYQFGGGNWKQKIRLFPFASLLSLLHPSSRPPCREGGGGAGTAGLPKPNYRAHCCFSAENWNISANGKFSVKMFLLIQSLLFQKTVSMNKIPVISVLENLARAAGLSSKLADCSWTSYSSYTSPCELCL